MAAHSSEAEQADEYSGRELAESLLRVAKFRPIATSQILLLSIGAAVFEGVSLGLIIPVIEFMQTDGAATGFSAQVYRTLSTVYSAIGIQISLGTLLGGLALIFIVRYSLHILTTYVRGKLTNRYKAHLRNEIVDGILHGRIAYLRQLGSDYALNTIVTETESAGGLLWGFTFFLQRIFLGIAYVLIGLWISPILTVIAISLLVVVSYVIRQAIESGQDLGERKAQSNEQIQQLSQTATQGLFDVKLFTLEDEILDKFKVETRRWVSTEVAIVKNKGILSNYSTLLTSLSALAIIYIAVTILNLGFGAIIAFLLAMIRLSPIASNLNSRIYDIENNIPHLTRCQELIDETQEQREDTNSGSITPERMKSLKFDNIDFSYDNNRVVLDGISFRVTQGQTIAFVGESGEGKSTIVSLIARLYEPDTGEIYANGTKVNRFDLIEWRDRISFIPQSPYIFNTTLRENVTISRDDPPEEEVLEVCETAQVTEFVDELENGFETELGDDGVRLSGGQKQRVAIARSLLKSHDILIMDEATSELDSNIESRVLDAIEGGDDTRITISIAHQLSSISHSDQIYVVEDGKISESGTHEELVTKTGKYAELYASQTQEHVEGEIFDGTNQ